MTPGRLPPLPPIPAPPVPPPPEALPVGPRTLALLADAAFGAPLVPALLDAFLEGAGCDPRRRWRLVLTGAEVVADGPAVAADPGDPGAARPRRAGGR